MQRDIKPLSQGSSDIPYMEELMVKLLPVIQEKQWAKGTLKMLSAPFLKGWGLEVAISALSSPFTGWCVYSGDINFWSI